MKLTLVASALLLAWTLVPQGLLATTTVPPLATEVVRALNAGDFAAITAVSRPFTVTCPHDELGPQPACQGLPDGTRVESYLAGVLGAGADFYDQQGYEARLRELVAPFAGEDLRIYTIAHGGLQIGGRCAGCFVAVASTPSQADLSDGRARVFSLQGAPGEDGLKITAVQSGVLQDEAATVRINGGPWGHLTFVRVGEPGPPGAGTGPQPQAAPVGEGVAALGLLLTVAGIAGLAVLAGRAATNRSR